MKRWQKVVAGVALAGTVVAGGLGVIAWRKVRHVNVKAFDVPVAAAVPAKLRLVPIATGLQLPTDIQFVPGANKLVVVLEQPGHARLLDLTAPLAGGPAIDARTAPQPIDLWVRATGEMGLVGLAFHPKYAENGKLYLHYGPWIHDALRTRIAEFTLPASTLSTAKAVETRVLFDIEQAFSVHQGGQLGFGPDGKLFVALGDGSTANDPAGNAQNLGVLQGKLLRVDVDAKDLVPKDNPFVGRPGARPEIWAYGLRNPWRFSFDTQGNAIVGDVGQEGREEVSLIAKGVNLGWNQREGRGCAAVTPQCTTEGLIDPILEYDRTVGNSVTGGYLVTGTRIPELTGKYVFADFARGRIWSMRLPASAPEAGAPAPDVGLELLGEWPRLLSTFGQDAAGDLYVADLASGELLALMPVTTP